MCFSNVFSAAWQVWGLNNLQMCLAQGYWNARFGPGGRVTQESAHLRLNIR